MGNRRSVVAVAPLEVCVLLAIFLETTYSQLVFSFALYILVCVEAFVASPNKPPGNGAEYARRVRRCRPLVRSHTIEPYSTGCPRKT